MAARSPKGDSPNERHVEDQVHQWLTKNRRLLLQATVGILAVVVVVVIITSADRARRREARAAAAAAYAPLSKALEIPVTAGFMGELDPDGITKRRAALEQVIADHPDSQAAIDARLHLAALAFETGDYAAAAAGFRQFAADYPNQEPLTALARLGEGDSLLAAGQLEDAFAAYDRAAAAMTLTANPATADRANLKAAVAAAMLGHTDEARDRLTQIVLSDSAFISQTAQSLLDRLEIIPTAEWQRLAVPAAASESADETDDDPAAG